MMAFTLENLHGAVTDTEGEIVRLNDVIAELKSEIHNLHIEADDMRIAADRAARATPKTELILINREANTCCYFSKDTPHEEALAYVVSQLGWHKNAKQVFAVRVEAKYEMKPTFERKAL